MTYEQKVKHYEGLLAAITAKGWSCTNEEADALLVQRKEVHAEMHREIPEYFTTPKHAGIRRVRM